MAERRIGLDIGTSAIRAVEMVIGDGRPSLENYGQVGLAPGTLVDGEIRDPISVTKAIQHLWRDGGFKSQKVMIGVAGLRAITREIDMLPVPLEELDDAAKYQADQVIPFPIDDTYLSTKVIAQFTDAEGAAQIRVLVAAAHREMIDGIIHAVEGAGLELLGIDLNTAALARALGEPSGSAGPEAIVSVGAGLTLVVVQQGGLLQFIRTIDLGGNSMTEAVAGALDLPLLDAEAAKRHLAEPGIHDSRAISSVETSVTDLVGEIHNSIRFYSSLPGRQALSRLQVTGAGAQTVGFLARLQEGLDLTVIPASPLTLVDNQLPITPEQAAVINPTLAVPIGLAMAEPTSRPFNLLPKTVSDRYAQKRIIRGFIYVGLVLLALIIAGTAWRIIAVHNARDTVALQTVTLKRVEQDKATPKYQKAVAISQQLTSIEAEFLPLSSSEVDWLAVFNQLSEHLPATSVITTFSSSAAAGASAPPGIAGGPATPATASTTPKLTVIGTGTASVAVQGPKAFSQLLNAMVGNYVVPGFLVTPITGSVKPTGTVSKFSVSFSLFGTLHTKRLNYFGTPSAVTAATQASGATTPAGSAAGSAGGATK